MLRKLTALSAIIIIFVSSAFAKDIVAEQSPYGIEKALQEAREARRLDGVTDVNIILKQGVYNVLQPIIIRPEDNGIRFKGEGKVVISGGVELTGWKKDGKMLVADVPMFNGRPLEFRQLYVNGKKAVRARDVQDFEKMYRILSMDKKKEVLYVPAAAVRNIVRQSKNKCQHDTSDDYPHGKSNHHGVFVETKVCLLILAKIFYGIEFLGQACHKLILVVKLRTLGEEEFLKCFVFHHNFNLVFSLSRPRESCFFTASSLVSVIWEISLTECPSR